MKNNRIVFIWVYLVFCLSSNSFAMDQLVKREFDQTIAYDFGVFDHREDETTFSLPAKRPQGILRQKPLLFSREIMGENVSQEEEPEIRGEDLNQDQEPVIRLQLLVPGKDRRTRIFNTLEWPYSIHVQLTMVSNDQVYGGSGTMVGPHHILTAAHNVFNQGRWVDDICVYPALNCQHEPFGEIKVVQAYTFSEWVNSREPGFDMALLILNKPIGYFTGWAGIKSTAGNYIHLKTYNFSHSVDMAQCPVTITGYPGDKDFNQMWTMSNKLKKINSETFDYEIDTTGGQSGSAIWIEENGDPVILGVHTLGSPRMNYGVRISTHKYRSLILKAIGDTYTLRVIPLLGHNNDMNQNFIYLDYQNDICHFDKWIVDLKSKKEKWAKIICEQLTNQRSLVVHNAKSASGLTVEDVKKLKIPGYILDQEGARYLVSTNLSALKDLNLSHVFVNNNNNNSPVSWEKALSQSRKSRDTAKNSPEIDDAVLDILANGYFFALGKLNLDYSKIKLGGMQALADGNFYAVQELSLIDCAIEDTEIDVLADGNFCAMQSLFLGKNNIGDFGGGRLANGCFDTLTLLDLQDNDIGDDGAAALANGNLQKVVKLILSMNNIGDRGVTSLANGNLLSLEELDLNKNNIGDEGTRALVNWNLISLLVLRLTNNPMNELSMKELREAHPGTKISGITPQKKSDCVHKK